MEWSKRKYLSFDSFDSIFWRLCFKICSGSLIKDGTCGVGTCSCGAWADMHCTQASSLDPYCLVTWQKCCFTYPYTFFCCKASEFLHNHRLMALDLSSVKQISHPEAIATRIYMIYMNLHSRSMMFFPSAGSYILDQTQNICVTHQQMKHQQMTWTWWQLAWADFFWFVGCVGCFLFEFVPFRFSSWQPSWGERCSAVFRRLVKGQRCSWRVALHWVSWQRANESESRVWNEKKWMNDMMGSKGE